MLSKIAKATTTAIILATIGSCAGAGRQTDTPEQILNNAMGENMMSPGQISTLPGADRSDLPYVPVITPPEIARIWIYDHVTPSNDLVVGHWIFIKLKDEKWYIEDQWEDAPGGTRKRPPLPQAEPAETHLRHADKHSGPLPGETQPSPPAPPAGR
ncbi:MAG: TraV family lipoprotein [Nitrospiraceae bacterium]|nr:TraV family lipoprotein [Nitrospiraceae bacterium]